MQHKENDKSDVNTNIINDLCFSSLFYNLVNNVDQDNGKNGFLILGHRGISCFCCLRFS